MARRPVVGMVGLGIMGSAMTASLVKAGFEVVGFDVVPRRRAAHRREGGTVARSCRDAGRRALIIVTSLPSACTASTVHDFTDSPSTSTVHAPHEVVSQPTFVPFIPSCSRRK